MFSNFIYFVLALITLALYQPTKSPSLSSFEALLGFICFSVLFAIFTRNRFHHLARRAPFESLQRLDQRYSALLTRHSIIALVTFAADVWILDLPSYATTVYLFELLPSLADLIFLSLFVGYLTIVWTFAYDAHRRIYGSNLSRSTYVYSHVAFSVPVLLPWALLFGISDLIHLLPFDLPKQILDTDIGQTVYFLLFLIVASIFAPMLIQRFWRCRSVEAGDFRDRIARLCQRAGVNYADIVYWPIFGGRMITAGVMGLIARFRYILVTDALLQLLSPDEVDQVIAHEIGHVKRKHLLLYLVFFVGFILVSYSLFPLSMMLLLFFEPALDLAKAVNFEPYKAVNTLYSVLIVAGIILYFRYIFGYFIRNFERQADLFVFQLFPTAQPLISTFKKIVSNSGQPADKPNWHHFSVQQRIDYLRLCEENRGWIKHHDRKIRNSIVVYLCALALLGAAVFQLEQIGMRFEVKVMESYLENKTPKTRGDAQRYVKLGNIYFNLGDEAAAINSYMNALNIDANHPEILNNLSWILSTSKSESLRNPPKALALAKQAVQLNSAPHIWDTLAEAFYANGQFEQAIDAEEKALSMNPKDRQDYEAQLAKFKQASGKQPLNTP